MRVLLVGMWTAARRLQRAEATAFVVNCTCSCGMALHMQLWDGIYSSAWSRWQRNEQYQRGKKIMNRL